MQLLWIACLQLGHHSRTWLPGSISSILSECKNSNSGWQKDRRVYIWYKYILLSNHHRLPRHQGKRDAAINSTSMYKQHQVANVWQWYCTYLYVVFITLDRPSGHPSAAPTAPTRTSALRKNAAFACQTAEWLRNVFVVSVCLCLCDCVSPYMSCVWCVWWYVSARWHGQADTCWYEYSTGLGLFNPF